MRHSLKADANSAALEGAETASRVLCPPDTLAPFCTKRHVYSCREEMRHRPLRLPIELHSSSPIVRDTSRRFGSPALNLSKYTSSMSRSHGPLHDSLSPKSICNTRRVSPCRALSSSKCRL